MWFGKCHWFACMREFERSERVCMFERQISEISIAPKFYNPNWADTFILISSFNLAVFDLTSNRFHIISFPSIWFDLLSSRKFIIVIREYVVRAKRPQLWLWNTANHTDKPQTVHNMSERMQTQSSFHWFNQIELLHTHEKSKIKAF